MSGKQSGFILFATLISLAVFSFLLLSQMQVIFLYHKSYNRYLKKNQAFYQLEAAANHLILTQLKQGSCQSNELNPNKILSLLKNQKGCPYSYEKLRYFYLVEDLGAFPCLQVLTDNRKYSTRHWRITIKKEGNTPVLQLGFAHLMPLGLCEEGNQKFIHLGLTSWRYLS